MAIASQRYCTTNPRMKELPRSVSSVFFYGPNPQIQTSQLESNIVGISTVHSQYNLSTAHSQYKKLRHKRSCGTRDQNQKPVLIEKTSRYKRQHGFCIQFHRRDFQYSGCLMVYFTERVYFTNSVL